MFGYILLQIPLQPLTKCTHRINCVKIVVFLTASSSWILHFYGKESIENVYFLKTSWRAITLLFWRTIPYWFPIPKITENFGDGHMARKQALECKTFLSLVAGSWVLSSYISTSQGSWRGQMQWGECQSPGIPLRETPSLVMPWRLGCLCKVLPLLWSVRLHGGKQRLFPSSNQLHTVPSNTHLPVSSSLSPHSIELHDIPTWLFPLLTKTNMFYSILFPTYHSTPLKHIGQMSLYFP